MIKTLELALSKAAALSAPAQEQLGRELLERIDMMSRLRADIELGLRELDAGLGAEIEMVDVIRQARAGHGRP
jgi:hypothetical protein